MRTELVLKFLRKVVPHPALIFCKTKQFRIDVKWLALFYRYIPLMKIYCIRSRADTYISSYIRTKLVKLVTKPMIYRVGLCARNYTVIRAHMHFYEM